eukprot:10707082-Heterocapsa_arctica.AAC.1
MADEVLWIENIESFTWSRLVAASEYAGEEWELRNSVVHASLVAAAFIDDKVLAKLKEYPWRLA